MIIIQMHGGLGNQLFLYALARSLEKNKGIKKIYFNTNPFDNDIYKRKYLLPFFQIKQYPIITKKKKKYFFSEKLRYRILRFLCFGKIIFYKESKDKKKTEEFFQTIHPKKNYYLTGYFQTGKIFHNIADILVKEIVPIQSFSRSTKKFLQKIKNSHSVSIHIRQKWNYDAYGNPTNIMHTQLALSPEHYQEKMQQLAKKYKNLHFFIIGDDLNWAKKHLPNIPGHYNHFIDNTRDVPDYEDIFLIAHCKQHISSNSSFCWWGEWLSKYYS